MVSVSRVAQTCVFLPVHQGQQGAEYDGRDFQSADIDRAFMCFLLPIHAHISHHREAAPYIDC